jgi:hypothetical protein
MAGAGRKWAIGCGIGCGLMVIILGGVGTCSFFAFKDLQREAEGLDEGFAELHASYGEADEYTPSPDGTIAPARVETFLAARDSMAAARARTSDMLATLDAGGNWIAKAKAGLELVPALMGFIAERNRVLLDAGMGVGEYQYIYTLAYYGLLAKSPGDGPSFVLADDEHEDDGGNVRMTWSAGGDEEEVRERRARKVRRYVHDLQLAILENQLAAFAATLPAGADPAGDPWGGQLVAEVAAMRAESLRFAWEEGLPAPLRDSLAPYRGRLEALYDPMTAIIEVGLAEEH